MANRIKITGIGGFRSTAARRICSLAWLGVIGFFSSLSLLPHCQRLAGLAGFFGFFGFIGIGYAVEFISRRRSTAT